MHNLFLIITVQLKGTTNINIQSQLVSLHQSDNVKYTSGYPLKLYLHRFNDLIRTEAKIAIVIGAV